MTAEIEKVTPARSRATRPSTARKTAAEKPASKIPAGAKKPADHASAKTDVAAGNVQRIEWRQDPETKKAFVYEIDADDFDDLDYVDAMIQMEQAGSDAEGATYAYIAMKTLLGPERLELWKQREKLTEGRVRFSAMLRFFESVMEQLKKGN